MDGLGPQSLPLHGSFCVWEGGAGISEVVCLHSCVRAFVRDCVCLLCVKAAAAPRQSASSSGPLFSFCLLLLYNHSPPPLPKVNLFTVILKGELFAVIVRTDEGQALRGSPACP